MDDDYLHSRKSPWDLDHKEYSDFMKRLRFKYKHLKLKFFMCGEYGEKNARPHYHAIVFGMDFDDKEYWYTTKAGQRIYRSAVLSTLWPHGYAAIGSVSFESAAYVARYVMKKRTGEGSESHYETFLPDTGEIVSKNKEYAKMSLKPALGREWYDKYKNDLYPKDYITVKGKKYSVPKYYDRLLEEEDPEYFEEIKVNRIKRAREHRDNNTYERLLTRERCAELKAGLFVRDFAHENTYES